MGMLPPFIGQSDLDPNQPLAVDDNVLVLADDIYVDEDDTILYYNNVQFNDNQVTQNPSLFSRHVLSKKNVSSKQVNKSVTIQLMRHSNLDPDGDEINGLNTVTQFEAFYESTFGNLIFMQFEGKVYFGYIEDYTIVPNRGDCDSTVSFDFIGLVDYVETDTVESITDIIATILT